MTSVTMKIHAFDAARAGYPVELVEDGHPPLAETLPSEPFVNGKWRVVIGNGVVSGPVDPADAPMDIVNTVMGTPGPNRAAIDWTSLGLKLFELLFPVGPLRERYKQWGMGTKLFLQITPEELERVPWELAQSQTPARLLSVNNSLTRLHAEVAGAGNSDWPFRVLIIVGCSTAEAVTLEVDREIDLIRRAFVSFGRSVDIHVMHNPLWEDLKGLVNGKTPLDRWAPHVLHFVGHTGIAADNTIGLMIDRSDSDNASWVWSAKSVQVLLDVVRWTPLFVFLNACRTGADTKGTWSFQRSFINAGAKCALTMQADVLGSLAGRFAGKLYERIASGESVQEATLSARTDVYGAQQASDLIDWALPALSACGEEIKLFKPRAPPDDADFQNCAEFRDARIFANCDAARRLLTHWMCPVRVAAPPAIPNNVVLLTGEALCGKSHILKWAMESWVLAGANVRYIELHDTRKKDFLAILREVRDGDGKDGKRFLQRRLPPGHFKRFNWTLNNLLETSQPGAWNDAEHPEAEIPDDDDPITAKGEERLEPIVCSEFHNALKAVAADKPLILVFDKFTADNTRLVRPEDFSELVAHLFRPIAKDASSRVKVVFSANLVERQVFKLDDIPSMMMYTVPDVIPMPDLIRYAVEMMRYLQEEDVRETATLLLTKFNTQAKGVARLAAISRALGNEFASRIQRMQ